MVPIKVAYEHYFGTRVRIARTQRGLTQQELALRMGLGDGQKIAAIESGKRAVKFQELEVLAQVLTKPAAYFTDPFCLVCEETPHYLLTAKVPKRTLSDFEKNTLYKRLGVFRFLLNYYSAKHLLGMPRLNISLPLTINSTPELAVRAGEQIANLLNLGTTPIAKLPTALAGKLGIMTLMLDAKPGIAGAALQLPEVGFIGVNRHQPPNKRSYAIAQELFRLLTWDTLPHEKNTPSKKVRKIEQLANFFAGSLLIPRQTVTQDTKTSRKQTTSNLVVENITDLGISAQALQVRLKQIEAQTGRDLSEVFADLELPQFELPSQDNDLPLPLSKLYVELLAKAVDEPLTSAKEAMRYLGCKTMDEAGDLFAAYGVTAPAAMKVALPQSRKG